MRRRSQPGQRRHRPLRHSGASGRPGTPGPSGSPRSIGVLGRPLPRGRTPRGVLRVPGGRRVVDGELARHLCCGLRVGLVIAGCRPAPAVPVPIAAHSVPPGVVEHPHAVLGRPLLVVRRRAKSVAACQRSSEVVRSTGSPACPWDADACSTRYDVDPCPSLITTRRGPAGPSAPPQARWTTKTRQMRRNCRRNSRQTGCCERFRCQARQSIRRGVPNNPVSASVGCVITYCRSRSVHHRVRPSESPGRESVSARVSAIVRPSSVASSGDTL